MNTDLLSSYLEGMSTTVLGLYNVMSGGAFAQATVFALGVQPYINSSIIIQLLTIAIPALERLARDGGEEGKKKIQSITRYATVAIAILQGCGYYMLMKNYGILTDEHPSGWLWSSSSPSSPAPPSSCGWASRSQSSVSATVSPSSCLPASCPASPAWSPSDRISGTAGRYAGTGGQRCCVVAWASWLLIVLIIVWVNDAERRIPVQYAKRQVGRKMYGGQASTLPMKVNMSGVLPIIFAQSIAMHPLYHRRFLQAAGGGHLLVWLPERY